MHFSHSDELWAAHPSLRPLVCRIRGLSASAEAAPHIQSLLARARSRLALGPPATLPSLGAWRAALGSASDEGEPARCRAETWLQHLADTGQPPQRQHPLTDLCRALAMAYAMPVAAYDCAAIADPLRVAYATGQEHFEDETAAVSSPPVGEVVVADGDGHVHARHWCQRYSPRSALQAASTDVLIVAEGLHAAAQDELTSLRADLAMAVRGLWGCRIESRMLSRENPVFAF
jgi:DNA/RNA-binding domain of Phe-tRNA-synthetase-like protein